MTYILKGRLKKKDYYQFAFKAMGIGFYLFIVVYVTVASFLLAALWVDDADGGTVLSFFLGLLALIIGGRIFRFWNDIRKNPTFIEERCIVINETGIRRENKRGYLQLKWTNIKRIKNTKSDLYVVTDAKQTVIIPKRFFKDGAEVQEAISFLKSKGVPVK